MDDCFKNLDDVEARGRVVSGVNESGILEFRVFKKNDPRLTTIPKKLCFSDKGLTSCGKMLDPSEFYLKKRKDGSESLSDVCRSCKVDRKLEKTLLRSNSNHDNQDDVFSKKIAGYRRYAVERGFAWKLTDIECIMLFQQNCVYCNAKPGVEGNCINRKTTEIKAYIIENSVTACSICNFVKLDHSVEKYVKICKTIASYKGLIEEKISYPEVFADSKSKKAYKVRDGQSVHLFSHFVKQQYANNTNRIMVVDKPTFEVLLLGDCYYCGKKNDPPKHYNGIDRIDNKNRKYELNNTVTCCKTCNTLKWSMEVNDFLKHVKKVAEFYDFENPNIHPPKTWATTGTKDNPISI